MAPVYTLATSSPPRISRHDLQIPLVFGVTGHRDLNADDTRRLENAVLQIFEEFKRRYPSTPLILLSPLAEGADRLVARVAQRRNIGAKLLVPLPMRQDLYEQDFKKHKSLEEFRELLEGADSVFPVPPHAPNDSVAHPGPERDARYRAVGEFIVRHSQILIALWDGKLSQGEGGTADIVELQRTGLAQQLPSIEPPEGFPAYWVPAAHSKNDEELDVSEPEWLYPDLFKGNKKQAHAYYDRIFQRANEFNNWVERSSAIRKRVSRSKFDVLGNTKIEGLSPEERLTLERYAVTDALAISFQRNTRDLIRTLHVLIFFVFFFFVLFAHVPKEWLDDADANRWTLLLPSGIALVFGVGLLYANRRFRIHVNYQDFRALAEGLRVELFWKLAGISDSVADYYLWSQRSELDWIRSGIRGWALPPALAQVEHEGHRLHFVVKEWVENQRAYFEDREKENEDIAHRNEWMARLFLILSAAGGFALAITAMLKPEATLREVELIVIDLLLAVGALLHNYNEKMAYARHAKQYGRMQPIFKYAAGRLREALDSHGWKKARSLLHQLGKQALAENGEWVVIHRERPVEVPHP